MRPFEKGNILEGAVKEIEEFIISNSSMAQAKSVSLFPKKKCYEVSENGKRFLIHEIDLFIKIDLGFENYYIYLIECKNWDCKSVSKTQILDFQAKIDYCGASKGIIIGKKFSPAASYLSQKNNRIELLKFDTDKHSNIIRAPQIKNVEIDSIAKVTRFQMKPYDKSPTTERPVDEVMKEQITVNEEPIAFSLWFENLVYSLKKDELHSHGKEISSFKPGTHTFNCSFFKKYEKNKLIFKNRSIKFVEIDFHFDLDVYETCVIMKLDIENRGRIIQYELIHPEKKAA